jgi:hypothetical protein
VAQAQAAESRAKANEEKGLSKQGAIDIRFKKEQEKRLEQAKKDNAFKGNEQLAWKMN